MMKKKKSKMSTRWTRWDYKKETYSSNFVFHFNLYKKFFCKKK
jgi:hypothetical protein